MTWVVLLLGLIFSVKLALMARQQEHQRRRLVALERVALGTAELLRDFATSQSTALFDLRTLLMAVPDLPDRLQAVFESQRRETAPTGAFLVTDEAAADQERLLQRAEDNFVASNGSARFSPLTSRPSRPSARPATSTRRAPTSGGR